MLLSIEGEEATGKTVLAYTAPLPIVGFSFDLGSERALYGTQFEKHFKGLDIQTNKYTGKNTIGMLGKDITIWELPQPVQLDSNMIAGCLEQWAFFIGKVGEALQDTKVRTLVVDTMTLARRLKADAYLQELQEKGKNDEKPRKQLQQIEYGHANDSIRNIYTACQGLGKNLIAIHHLTDEYKPGILPNGTAGSVASGKRILEGLAQTYRYVDVAIRMEKVGKKLTGVVNKCGYNLDLEGERMDDLTWDRLVNRVMLSLEDRIKLGTRNGH